MRTRLRTANLHRPRTDGAIYRGSTKIGDVGGILYVKRLSGFSISLTGQIADQPDGEYLMALYPDTLPAAQEGDEFRIGTRRYHVLAIRDSTAYQTYRLEAIV